MSCVIPWATPSLWGNEEQYVVDALRSTWISGGPYVDRFEHEFASYCDVPHVVSVTNGTAALHLAYLAMGIGPGDEVIVPGFAFMAAANMARMVGATPVFADIDVDGWCVTPATIQACLSPRTRAIVPVHTYGNVCDMDEINALAAESGVSVIEDAAEAIGSRYRGRMAGSLAPVSVFSFHATKTITTGEGGAVATSEVGLEKLMRLYRSHGVASTRYWHDVAGHNFRLTNLQAAIGCAQLEQVSHIVTKRGQVFAEYSGRLARMRGIALQAIGADVDPVIWAVAVRLDPAHYPQGRDRVIAQMAELGIETRPGFHPATALHHLYGPQVLPVCDEVANLVLVLPSSPALSLEDITRVCGSLASLAE